MDPCVKKIFIRLSAFIPLDFFASSAYLSQEPTAVKIKMVLTYSTSKGRIGIFVIGI